MGTAGRPSGTGGWGWGTGNEGEVGVSSSRTRDLTGGVSSGVSIEAPG